MEPEEYDRMDTVEDSMWWYRALHARVLEALASCPGVASLPVLDAGCGTGGLLRRLAAAAPGRGLAGLDLSSEAVRRAQRKVPGAFLAVGSICRLPFRDGGFGAVVSCDVLSHRMVDEQVALAELHRVLAPGGTLVLNLPAHEWLRSAHDERVHNARRYNRRRLRDLLERAGFGILRLGHWNTLLLPLMILQRKVLSRVRSGGGHSDVALFPPPIEAMLRAATDLEAALARLGFDYPAGGSILVVARRC